MRLFFGIFAAAVAIVAACLGPLSWDGGWILFALVDSGRPVLYADRFTSVPLHLLVLAVGRLTSNLRLLELVFSGIYASIPLVSLAICWWVVRRSSPSLFVWAVLGIGLATLPGQFNFLSDSLLAVHLFWPVLLWMLCGFPRAHSLVAGALAVAVLFAHPAALPMFGGAAVVAGLMAWRQPSLRRRMSVGAAAFAAGAALKLVLYALARTSYDTSEASLEMQLRHFEAAVSGSPLAAVACGWVAGAIVYLRSLARREGSSWPHHVLSGGPVALLVAAGTLLTGWAMDTEAWAQALDFRNWALVCSFPFVLFAVMEALRQGEGRPPRPLDGEFARRVTIMQTVSIVFLLVIAVQSTGWVGLTNRLRDAIARSQGSCLAFSDVDWAAKSPLNHWATPAYAALLQGQHPGVSVVYYGDCSPTGFAEALRWGHSGDVRTDGWFTLPR